jgi:hypothetical protein
LPVVNIKGNTFNYTGASAIYASGIFAGTISGNTVSNCGLYPNNVYLSEAASHNNTSCAYSICAAGLVHVESDNRYETFTNPRISDNNAGTFAPTPTGEGVQVTQPRITDRADISATGQSYTAQAETSEVYANSGAGHSGSPATCAAFTLFFASAAKPE